MAFIKRLLKTGVQVLVLTLASLAGSALSTRFHWPVPGSVVGMLLVLALLYSGLVRVEWVDAGAAFLLSEMLLFFVPAAVGVVQYGHLLAASGLRILLVIGLSTLLVMACTGAAAELLSRHRRRGGRRPEHP